MKRRLRIAWSLLSALCVMLVASATITWGVIALFGDDDPVSVHDGTLLTHRVPMGGSLQVTFTADRRRSCPGSVVHTYTSIGDEPTRQIIRSYPAIDVAAKVYRRDLSINLPLGIEPGRWNYSMTLNSNCSGRHTIDPVVSGIIEVYQP